MPVLRLLVCLVAPLLACIEFEHHDGDTSEPPESPTTGEDPPPPPQVNCDPLVQDCPEGEACTVADHEFVCVTVAVDGAAGDPCVVASECGVGLLCVAGTLLADCDTFKCCTPLCDVADAGADCPGAGETCTAIFSGPNVPPDIQSYGACELPE